MAGMIDFISVSSAIFESFLTNLTSDLLIKEAFVKKDGW